MAPSIHAIIVSHNSQLVLPRCLEHLQRQSPALRSIVVVDSGSEETTYLDNLRSHLPLHIIKTDNCGFSTANNLGFQHEVFAPGSLVIFLNPDTFLSNDFTGQMIQCFSEHPRVTMLSGKLLRFDLQTMQETNIIDSTGIYRRWYGRWFDRGQGHPDHKQYDLIAEPPALCGALLCCRTDHLQTLGDKIFDEDLFLYKEDIELSLRLRKYGKKLLYDPRLIAYHCRGWQGKRRNMDYRQRIAAAKSELTLYRKHPSMYMVWAICKYLLVRFAGF
jgi:N-acetylglucosaminyl-diphospho-decaprenol L-rhamnosyltransferase